MRRGGVCPFPTMETRPCRKAHCWRSSARLESHRRGSSRRLHRDFEEASGVALAQDGPRTPHQGDGRPRGRAVVQLTRWRAVHWPFCCRGGLLPSPLSPYHVCGCRNGNAIRRDALAAFRRTQGGTPIGTTETPATAGADGSISQSARGCAMVNRFVCNESNFSLSG